jgi:UDP-N-acetylmuramyl pentapeptide phosphotransferase/UDP-N-acetylglucosamine-1-phosphate transferase
VNLGKPYDWTIMEIGPANAWLGFIGFLDDYIKVFKKNKKGLARIKYF